MSAAEIVDLCSSDDEVTEHHRLHTRSLEVNRSSSALSICLSYSYFGHPMEEHGGPYLHGTTALSLPQICRNFWKAGFLDKNDVLSSKLSFLNTGNYLHVHPLFLHSNATSHKWVFGAIAELMDNAVDEIQNGATFVLVDKVLNPKDGFPALLIQDDGGGMQPEAMRQCMSFGFSDKSKTAIGQYGNGFKAGGIRLGADVIVFSRHWNNTMLTQIIGLLSFTYLMRAQHNRVVVPMVNYKFDTSTEYWERLNDEEHFRSNLSILLHWSPYSSEEELLKQFEGIESHGTKIIIFNLWFNNDGSLELDFDSDPEDICIAGDVKKFRSLPAWKIANEEYIANRFHYSLRAYLSMLYLRIPKSFRIILRGQDVELRNIADDLKYPEFILYKPNSGGSKEVVSVTTIGFVKEAPKVNIHGFNVYHNSRLILPFWQVVNHMQNSRGRGVVGILCADYLEPTHNKQDFERTSLFQKLELRLRQMTWEYWDYHCHLIGYSKKRSGAPGSQLISSLQKSHIIEKPVELINCSALALMSNTQNRSEKAPPFNKRKTHQSIDLHKMKRQEMQENVTVAGCDQNVLTTASPIDQTADQRIIILMEAHKKLSKECLEYEKTREKLNLKVTHLRSKIQEAQRECDTLMAEVQSLG